MAIKYMADFSKTGPDRRRLLKNGEILPNMRKGLSMVAFAPGIREYKFATPAMLDQGVLLTNPGYEYRMSDYICVNYVLEQPKIYKNYINGIYQKQPPEITQEDRTEMLRVLDGINRNYAIKDLVMPKDIMNLDSDPEAYSRIWDSIYSDPEKYHSVRAVLLNAEFRTLRTLTHSIFSDGAAHIDELTGAFNRTREKILELELSDKTKGIILTMLKKLEEACREHADPISHMVIRDQYNKAIEEIVDRRYLGAEKGSFTDLLGTEINNIQWQKAIPETTYLYKDDLREYFDQMNEGLPEEIAAVNESLYKALNDYIERESRVIHTYENPYKKHQDDELDYLEGQDSPMPMQIVYAMTVSNDAADKHEANIIISDGESCSFEKISMDSDGTISSARANVGINGVIADLDVAADRDVFYEEKEVEHITDTEPKKTSVIVADPVINTTTPDITDRFAVAEPEEEELFEEI